MKRILLMAAGAGVAVIAMSAPASAAQVISSDSYAVVIPPGQLLKAGTDTVIFPTLDRAITITGGN